MEEKIESNVRLDTSEQQPHRVRLPGFISDEEDPQQVAWVNVSERDSFLGRMLAHFSLFVIPGQ